MSDFLTNGESGRTVQERLFHSPQTFDARVFLDKKFASKIAGCSSFSFSRVAKGLSPTHISIQPFSFNDSVNCELDPEVHKKVFGSDWRDAIGKVNYLQENRKFYGQFWASMELAEEYDVPLEIWDPSRGGLIHEVYNLLAETRRFNEKDDIAKGAGKIIEKSFYKNEFLTGFGSLEKIANYLHDLRSRGGVQIIYMADNKLDFADFIKSRRHKAEGDRAVKIFSGIPDKFIGALVPLGKYEREKLSKLI